MWVTRMAAGVVALAMSTAVVMTSSPVSAKEIVITELGHAPLLGTPITSTAELKRHFNRRRELFAEGAQQLGLSQKEYERVRLAIATSTPAYVKIPRHLDAMTGYWDGHVHALHNVRIPENQYGWVVAIPEGTSMLAVYIPAKCGNISFVRRTHTAVAQVTPRPKLPPPFHQPAPAPVAVVTPAPVALETPVPAVVPGEVLPASVSRRAGFLPYIGAAIIPFIPFIGGGPPNSPPNSPPICPNGAVDP